LIREAIASEKFLTLVDRILETMGFLATKGFLKTNLEMPLLPNKRLRVEDVIWAGQGMGGFSSSRQKSEAAH
jgi:hypothetical protein